MRILSPAKINLFLHVIAKRPDGYHDLCSLMCPIGLYDEIDLQFGGRQIRVACSDPRVPEDETNLAHKAAMLFCRHSKQTAGVTIRIDKHIPVGAGLGGGSSNAAAVLLGLNQYYGRPFTREQLLALGLKIGADVPFFIFQRPALALGVGEKLEEFPGLPSWQVVLINPGFTVSTAEVYRNLNLGLTNCEKKFTRKTFNKQGFDAACHLCNDLERVTASKYPFIHTAKEQLLNCGALGALMSGSGPTVFGLFADPAQAREAQVRLAGNFSAWQLWEAEMLVGSAELIPNT